MVTITNRAQPSREPAFLDAGELFFPPKVNSLGPTLFVCLFVCLLDPDTFICAQRRTCHTTVTPHHPEDTFKGRSEEPDADM